MEKKVINLQKTMLLLQLKFFFWNKSRNKVTNTQYSVAPLINLPFVSLTDMTSNILADNISSQLFKHFASEYMNLLKVEMYFFVLNETFNIFSAYFFL